MKAAALTPIGLSAVDGLAEAQSDTALPIHFSHPDIIRYDHQCFSIHGHDLYLFSSCFHYFRCAPPLWNDRLDKIKAAGFNAVESYVAWNWHQPHPPYSSLGKADMEPLDSFIRACAEHELFVIMRPGPYICAEWNGGGFPSWLAHYHIGYRTDRPANEKWSSYWYDTVLPVIRKHLITHGGNVILVQLENEYDFSGLPKKVEADYIKSLYRDAVRNRIDVPLITCWTSVARDNSDPIMSQIMDACNFYPGWGINSTLGSIQAMLAQEPKSPAMITELQGGWFSNVGGRSVRHPQNFGPDQINALTKFVMAHGVAASSYYMGYGGTNFGYWGSPGRTTSYDYTAPIAEPGGLWDKYRAVKLIGDFVRIAGPIFVRSTAVANGVKVSAPNIEALLRQNGKTGFLFIRNNEDRTRSISIQVTPDNGTSISLTVPLGPRDARFLEMNFSVGDATLDSSNLELAEANRIGGTPFILAYGDPGDQAAIVINGVTVNRTVTDEDQIHATPDAVVALASRERAGKSRTFSVHDENIVLVSDSYFINPVSSGVKQADGRISLDVETLPGANRFTLFSPRAPKSLHINGKPVETTSETAGKAAVSRFTHQVSDLPFQAIEIRSLRMRREAEAPRIPMTPVTPRQLGGYNSLDLMGHFDNGYTVYRGMLLPIKRQGDLEFQFYDSDWHAVYLDNQLINELTGSDTAQRISPAKIGLDTSRAHPIEIIYENEGRPNGGFMEQEKGIRSIRVATSQNQVQGWKLSPKPAGELSANPSEAQTNFNDSNWIPTEVGNGTQAFFNGGNINGWFRTHLNLTSAMCRKQELRLRFGGVDDNGVVFVNGHKVVAHQGWDQPFEAPLHRYVKPGDNVIAVYVQNVAGPGGIWRPVELLYNTGGERLAALRFHGRLAGEAAGWNEPHCQDMAWQSQNLSTTADPANITWYRTRFYLPDTRGWDVRWSLEMQATGNAQIWLNGVLVGRFFPQGPQTRFYLPECWLKNGSEPNTLALVMRPHNDGTTAPALKSLRVTPFLEYSPKVDRLEIEI